MSDKREGRGKGFGTQIFDSKNMKGRQAEAGRRVQPSATGKHANDPPDGGTIGGLPLGGGARAGRRGSVGGRRGSQDNGRRGSVDAGKGRRGSVDSGDADKDKEKDKEKADSTGAASAGLTEDRDSIIEKQQRRAIALSQKGDWPALEHCVKTLERMVPDPPSIPPLPYHPLRDIVDEATGYTPLMYAARENKSQFIERLIDLGCDPNFKNKDGYSAVHLAAMYSREDTIRHLVHKKGDINAIGGPYGQTTIHMVCERAQTARRFMGSKAPLVKRPSHTAIDGKRTSATASLSIDTKPTVNNVSSDVYT